LLSSGERGCKIPYSRTNSTMPRPDSSASAAGFVAVS
jgi:hypothetical protein